MQEILRNAALRNDGGIFSRRGQEIAKHATDSLTEKDDNALHIAVLAGSSNFITNLLEYMDPKDLERLNGDGNTAFFLAAKYGRVRSAAARMLSMNRKLLSIRGEAEMLPIQIAAEKGHIRMVESIYDVGYQGPNSENLSEEDCKKLLPNLVCIADLIDIAWKLLQEHPNIVDSNIEIGRTTRDETFLHVLARTHLISLELSNQNEETLVQIFFQIFFKKSSHINKCPHEKLPKEALDLLKHFLDKINRSDEWMEKVIVDAVQHENVEFLSLIICDYSGLMDCTRTAGLIFSNAISKRQKDIFRLLDDLHPSFWEHIVDYRDSEKNNILHLAGKLSPPERLDAICGVAQQLQEELKWFKEVSEMVAVSKACEKNKAGKTPKALFDEEHKQLKGRAEQWIKGTAKSCMIVATLIATVGFGAPFTVRGGTNEESGMPRFSNQLSFRIILFADTISVVLSVYSLLIFLAVQTSRYAEEDFLLELPRKLVFGLLTLWLSIAAMMVVFCTSIFVVFKVDIIWVQILLSVSASSPVLHFVKMNRRLLYDVVRKTIEVNSILKEENERGVYTCLEHSRRWLISWITCKRGRNTCHHHSTR